MITILALSLTATASQAEMVEIADETAEQMIAFTAEVNDEAETGVACNISITMPGIDEELTKTVVLTDVADCGTYRYSNSGILIRTSRALKL